jgi:hypothetical protein
MKQPLLLSTFILLLAVTCLGQSNSQNTTPQAQKFDEFEFLARDDRERVARFAEALTKNPTAKGYIIFYQERVSGFCGPVGVGSAIWFLRNMLEGRLDFPVSTKRVVDIRGGLREKQMVEFFIVPKGAAPPVPTSTSEPNKATRCPCLSGVYAPSFVFENTSSPLPFYATGQFDDPKEKPIYKWAVSAGRIISGQGTMSIMVERPSPVYQRITATLEVDGFSSECNLKSSATSPEELSSLPIKIDEFEEFSCEEELARLDYLKSAGLHSDPLAQGYIIVYGRKNGRRNEVKARIASMKASLIMRGVGTKRVTFIDGGFREKLSVEMWLVEKGKNAPVPTPTIEAKDVKLKGFARIYNEPCMQ